MSCNKKNGKLILISGPSGSGKTTIVKHLLSSGLDLVFSISACSREKRKNEKDGVDYHFLSTKVFKEKIASDDFLEWEEVYDNNFYGTLKSEVMNKINLGHNVIFDIDVMGAKSLKKIFANQAFSIFIQAPSIDSINQRLSSRNTESEGQISFRVNKARYEEKEKKFFDYILINNDLSLAKKDVLHKVQGFLK